jgi:hypothetical protein
VRPDELTLEEQLIASTAIANFRTQKDKPMDKVTFETNTPQTIALKYATGKRVESRYNEYEVYYTTADGRALYASPALDQQIVAFHPEAGVPFSIVKREVKDGNRKRIEWQVQKPASEAPAPVETTRNTVAPNGSTSSQHTAPVAPAGTMTQLMGGALIAAIDSLLAAREYGARKGFALEFNEEDVRSLASTIFINFTKTGSGYVQSAASAPYVNGGYSA